MSRSNMNQKVQTMEWMTNVGDECMTELNSMVYPVFIRLWPQPLSTMRFIATKVKLPPGLYGDLDLAGIEPQHGRSYVLCTLVSSDDNE